MQSNELDRMVQGGGPQRVTACCDYSQPGGVLTTSPADFDSDNKVVHYLLNNQYRHSTF